MNKLTKYIAFGMSAAVMASCADLDTEYLGGYVTPEQKGDVLEQNPELGQASLIGITSNFVQVMKYWSGHLDFGYPAVMIGLEEMGMDYVAKNSGYNWFNSYQGYRGGNGDSYNAAQMWYYMYNQIFICNAVAKSIPEPNTDETKFYRAQALAVRAFDYWNLIQFYQWTYDGHQNLPGVPVITDVNADEVAANGAGRGTVEETYAQIMKDLNEAIELLSGNSVQPSQILDTKPKRLVSLATAYGLRARVNLTMHKYAEAAADAQQAIANFSGSPYSMDAVSEPTFTSITDGAWMWGIAVNETDDGIAGGSIVNFPAMTCSFAHGYCDQGGAWRWASKKLYDAIPSSDVRKGWWLDENRKSVNLTEAQQAYLDAFATAVPSYGADQTANLMPYTNVKFNSYQGVLRQGLNASDIPLMRVEEMYLTLAEGQAMSGNVDGGRQTLENFVTTYRDPSYASHANSAEEVQEACWNQRRIELWGEGLAFFDIARLHKTIDRRGCAYPAAHVYVIEPGSNCLRQCIPTEEIAANKQLTSQSNNPVYAIPTPVRDN